MYLLNTGDFDIKKECAWAVSNASSWKNRAQVKYLASQGAIPAMCNLLKSGDTKVLNVAMEFLENVLATGQLDADKNNSVNPYVDPVEEAEGLDHLENLQNHKVNIPRIFRESSDSL